MGSLKYVGGYIREVGTERWGKLFYTPQILSDVSLAFELVVSNSLLSQ